MNNHANLETEKHLVVENKNLLDSLKLKNKEIMTLTVHMQDRESKIQKLKDAIEQNTNILKTQSKEMKRLEDMEIGYDELETRYVQLKRYANEHFNF